MKQLTINIIFGLILITGCEYKKPDVRVSVNNSGGQLITDNGMMSYTNDIKEFEYKGHLYIYSKVRDGIAMSHAGHCHCNN